ncbi:hypothetical protein JDV02_005609 [Purpureocillium takamizusanense]|uniref:Uncharacterized protein n=1 Tax=Purpureocillium takamizusanense TaxID=2060973 RepID=A0A9Q8QGY2_9HYPO|nr:uncharacterized protein JDV02_005609 [Purpureocillium takamizusanense]UNI19425.1 hypothetical protein JDV02_005609 [Purpureocillium takamizusanense]
MGNWFGWHLSGYLKRRCLSLFIVLDICCVGLQVPEIVVLAVAGLPWSCEGLTTVTNPGEPTSGHDTSGFGSNDKTGALDQYCGIPKSSFWLSIVLILLYFYSIGLSIRQMVALGKRAKVGKACVNGDGIAQAPAAQPQAHLHCNRHEHEAPRAMPGEGDLEDSVDKRSSFKTQSTSSMDPPPYSPDRRESLDKETVDHVKKGVW